METSTSGSNPLERSDWDAVPADSEHVFENEETVGSPVARYKVLLEVLDELRALREEVANLNQRFSDQQRS